MLNPDPSVKRHFLTTTEAARVAQVSSVTIVSWCKKHRLGRQVGGKFGRWRVDPDKLVKFLKGKPK